CRRHRLPPAPLPPPCQRRSLHLAPRESDHLLLHSAGRLAQYRLARGLRLNVPEARALIAMQMMEMVRNGSATTVDGPPVGGGGGGGGAGG
ncbi:urease subunit gamma, partial [bacterium]|nr:urease subunit gamma [bacterium]